ncbi:hypothetical protein DUNSADRAFT_5756 [Dunaliella salina]|uniref:Encoded protein n=1 Tax=Dunaliella salina TaxID=3046 RepID=A0ABQ7H746_DUNSA|nr:hypothetical protein DUNSADRAFT_5756 [Dunaliella salina]|eukprot:KAF5842680.1 hypothetical protein DUNSADRAFT_5756 [Dunaliella salina]
MGISYDIDCISNSHVVVDTSVATIGDHPIPSLLPVLNVIWPQGSGPLMQATAENVECWRMSGAMTNLVFRCDFKGHRNSTGALPTCSAPGSAPKHIDSVIVRIEGLPSFDRAMELKCFKTAARVGIGARLLVKFANGRVEECFKEHRAMEPADMTEPVASSEIAATLANFHTLMVRRLP